MDHRSPLDNIFNIISGLPQGHDKPVKHAFYNAVGLFVLFLCCAAGWALYIILQPFIKPLVWALLVGSVLHPIKHGLREQFRKWFQDIDDSGTPILIGICILPVNIINNISEFIGSNLVKYIKPIIAVGVAIPAVLALYYYTPSVICTCVWNILLLVYGIVNFFINNASIYAVALSLSFYLSALAVLWTPENNRKFHYVSIGMWLLISCYLAQLFGSLQVLVFILIQVILFIGFTAEVCKIQENMNELGQVVSFIDAISLAFQKRLHQKSNELEEKNEGVTTERTELKTNGGDPDSMKTEEAVEVTSKTKTNDPWSLELFEKVDIPSKSQTNMSNPSLLITNKGNVHVIHPQTAAPAVTRFLTKDGAKPPIKRSLSQSQMGVSPYFRYRSGIFNISRKAESKRPENLTDGDEYLSDFYIYSLIWACICMLFWKNVMLLPFLPIPILIYVTKHVGLYLGIWNWLYGYWCLARDTLHNWCDERSDALLPLPLKGLWNIMGKANTTIKGGIKDSIDTVASCVVIFGLLIFVACASMFIVFQVYTEAIMLVQMFSNVINQTVVHNPELRQLLPPTFDDTVDSILDNAYQYGREGISKVVRSMMNNVDSEKSAKLENQILELWDRVYQAWMSSNDENGPKVTQAAVETSWNAFLDDIKKSPEMFNVNGLVEFLKQNVGTLMSLLESVWSIVKGNISLVLGSFSAFLSVIFGGGTAVLNFILNVIVFLTTLFYLLSCSADLYKPVELLTNFSPSGSRFGLALEGAVNGVFKASFKMAVFYGMWTWFIHNLFGVKIVYLPSAFATILGAVPFLGTYWACIPAVLDLWLAQDRGILAILFAAFQFLPTSVVDTIIYKEIKGGGHPYLTGLAIAGGIFCLGVEGAIIGPLILCGLYVAADLSSNFFKDSPSEESLNLQLHLQNT